jgi:hypothetical protein
MTTGILTGLLSLTLLATPQPAAAADPFAFITMLPPAGLGGVWDGDTQVIPRNSGLRIEFNQPVDPATISGNITVTTSAGADAGWTAQGGWINTFVDLNSWQTLPKNTTYTVRIKGGAAGIKSATGATLPSDITRTVRTDNNPVERAVDLPSHWGQSGLIQSDIYQVKVSAGLLRIVASDLPENATMRVALESQATGEILIDAKVEAGGPVLERLLPEGAYSLLLAPNFARAVTLHGPDLEVSQAMPGLQFPDMEPFATRNERFVLQAELINGQPAKSLAIMLGKDILASNILRADGSVAPITIDPTKLADGLYALTGLAAAKDTGNQAVQARTMLVDRADSFADVPSNHWARRYVEIMRHVGALNGRSETQFAPAQPVTRAEFAKMLALTLGMKPTGTERAPFEDMPDDWSTPHIDALYERGLIKGETIEGKTYYYPNRTISRAEAATIIGRLIADVDLEGETADFTDWDAIPSWARPSVVVLAEMKWINGFPDGRYQPMQTLQRDQAARIFSNFLGVR